VLCNVTRLTYAQELKETCTIKRQHIHDPPKICSNSPITIKLTKIQCVRDNMLQIDKSMKFSYAKMSEHMLFSVINVTRLIMVNSIDIFCFLFTFSDLHKN